MPKKDINLLPHEDFEKKPLGKFLIWALSVGRWIVIVTELIVILAFLSRFKLDRDLADLYESIRTKQAIIASSSVFEKDFRLFQTRLQTADKLVKNQLQATKVISAMAAVTPVDVALASFTLEGSEIKLTGLALSEAGLKSFINGLNLSPEFTDISLANVTKQKEEADTLKFSLTTKVKMGETQK